MSGGEKLFAALSGVDETLLERSERRVKRRSRWLGWGAALAACLAAVVAAGSLWPRAAIPPDREPPEDPAGTVAVPAELPEGEGRYHLLQFRLDRKQDAPGFSLFVNEENYYAYERDGVYVVRPRLEPENLPACRLEISWTGTPPEEEVKNQAARLGSLYENVWDSHSAVVEDMWPAPWDAYVLWADSGTDWDDAQGRTWVVGDGQGGSFVLSASYFMEAAEGHGVSFYDMMCTFRAESEDAPAWQADLERAAEERIREILPAGAGVASIDYSVAPGADGALAALVTVEYRPGSEEPCETAELELAYRDQNWKVIP